MFWTFARLLRRHFRPFGGGAALWTVRLREAPVGADLSQQPPQFLFAAQGAGFAGTNAQRLEACERPLSAAQHCGRATMRREPLDRYPLTQAA